MGPVAVSVTRREVVVVCGCVEWFAVRGEEAPDEVTGPDEFSVAVSCGIECLARLAEAFPFRWDRAEAPVVE